MVFEEIIENIKGTPSYEMDELYKWQSANCENETQIDEDPHQDLKVLEEAAEEEVAEDEDTQD